MRFRHIICFKSLCYYLRKGGQKGNIGGLRDVPTPPDFDFVHQGIVFCGAARSTRKPARDAGFPFWANLLDTVGDFVFFPITVMKKLQNRGVGLS